MRQNMLWALAYNAVSVPLAACGFVPPWLAAIGMSTSSLAVITNSLRIRFTSRTLASDRTAALDDADSSRARGADRARNATHDSASARNGTAAGDSAPAIEGARALDARAAELPA
jgi:hypothetical protein